MQIEIKCALEFLLSYLYDKLPRRRVNLFGDELEKYLKLKLITSDSKICLNINFTQNNMELIDPCLIAASKESAMDLKEILDCWPSRLKLFIETASVSYSIGNELNQTDSTDMKLIYSEKNDLFPVSVTSVGAEASSNVESGLFDLFQMGNKSGQSQRRGLKNPKGFVGQASGLTGGGVSKTRGLNLNLNNSGQTGIPAQMFSSELSPGSFNNVQIGATSPFQSTTDFLSLSSSSSTASTSSSSSHLSNPSEDTTTNPAMISPTLSNVAILTGNSKPVSMFTTAAFAQTKFGSTKSKNNYTRQTKQHKMLPNEFSAYIRNKVRILNETNGGGGSQRNIMENTANLHSDNLGDYSFMNEQLPSIALTPYSSSLMSPQFNQSSFFKTGQTNNINDESHLPYTNAPANTNTNNNLIKNMKFYTNSSIIDNTSRSQLIQPELLLTNSTVNELEENLINNYFTSTFSSPSSSIASSSSSSSSYNHEIKQKFNSGPSEFLNVNNNGLLNQINDLTI